MAHCRCDRSAEDAYSSAAPDPTFAFVRGLCCPTLDFAIAFWIMINFTHFYFAILYHILLAVRNVRNKDSKFLFSTNVVTQCLSGIVIIVQYRDIY
jgi:hypothetical protein